MKTTPRFIVPDSSLEDGRIYFVIMQPLQLNPASIDIGVKV